MLVQLRFLSSEAVKSGALLELVPTDQLLPEYGGTSDVKLGRSLWDVNCSHYAQSVIENESRHNNDPTQKSKEDQSVDATLPKDWYWEV
jgi:hypothetical protein